MTHRRYCHSLVYIFHFTPHLAAGDLLRDGEGGDGGGRRRGGGSL